MMFKYYANDDIQKDNRKSKFDSAHMT